MGIQTDTGKATWPESIPLPQAYRDWPEPESTPALVSGPGDLPQRLFMGSLNRDSLRRSADGWVASYEAGIPGTGCDVEYNLHDGALTIHWTYGGNLVFVSTGPAETFTAALRGLASDTPVRPRFLRALRDEVQAKYNAVVPDLGERPDGFVYYPDGFLFSLLCPVPVARLRELPEVMKRIERDRRVGAVVEGHVTIGCSVVNYIEGRNGPLLNHPLVADVFAAQSTGLPVICPSAWETAPSGTRALTVRRGHYLLHLSAFLPDVELVLEHLVSAGLAALRGDVTGYTHPAAHEFAVIVLPTDALTWKFELAGFDALHTRRVVYAGPIPGTGANEGPRYDPHRFAALVDAAESATGALFAKLAL